MKIKTRPKHASMLQTHDRRTELRDGSRDSGRVGRGYPPLRRAELEWHHFYPGDEAHPRWQISGKPSRYVHSLAAALNPARAWRAYGGPRRHLAKPVTTARI